MEGIQTMGMKHRNIFVVEGSVAGAYQVFEREMWSAFSWGIFLVIVGSILIAISIGKSSPWLVGLGILCTCGGLYLFMQYWNSAHTLHMIDYHQHVRTHPTE